MAARKANPEHFLAGPGGKEYDPELFKEEKLRAQLVELVTECCLEHGSKIADKILQEYKITPLRPRPYP